MTERTTSALSKAGKPVKDTAAAPKAASGFARPMVLSPALAAVIGPQPGPRTDVTKRLWDYIKSNKLQDPANKRMINADEKLRPVFDGKAQVSMFEMTKLVSAHLS